MKSDSRKRVRLLILITGLACWAPSLWAQSPTPTATPTLAPTLTPTPTPAFLSEFMETFEGAYPPSLWVANGAERIDSLSHSPSRSVALQKDGDYLVTPFMETTGNQLQFFYRVTDNVLWRMLRLDYSTDGTNWQFWWRLSCTPNVWFRKQLELSTLGAQPVKVRLSWDDGNDAGAKVYVDDVSLSSLPVRAAPSPLDFDGDGVSDLGLYWPEGGMWYARCSGGVHPAPANFGWGAALPEPGDYDGDYITDHAVYWPEGGMWYIDSSSCGQLTPIQFGWDAMIPTPADYDGDGLTDIAGYHAGWWYFLYSGVGAAASQSGRVTGGSNRAIINYGWAEAVPVPADYDGDGKTDLAVYYPPSGAWYILRSSDGQQEVKLWGWSQAWPVPADYDGDGKDDIAVYEYANGKWSILGSTDGPRIEYWGWAYGIPIPAPYSIRRQSDYGVLSVTDYTWNVVSCRYGPQQPFQFGWNEAVPL